MVLIKKWSKSSPILKATLSKSSHPQLHDIVEDVRDDLFILLENNNIEQIVPTVGGKYSSTDPEYKVVKRVEAIDSETEMTIKNTIKPGYKLNISNNQSKIIQEAEVSIYNKIKSEVAINE